MLIFVLFVLKIDLDIFTAYLNAWLYSYQIILHLIKVENEVFDPFISFVIGLANWRFHVTGFCFIPGLTNFYKLGINYILPFYVLFLLFVLSKISRFFPRCYINRNVSHALCNLLVLCYTDITTISFNILHYAHLGGKWVLYFDGNIDFFEDWKTHLPFTILAIVLVIFFVILLPLTLLFTPWFFNRFPYFVRFRLFFDLFQSCFEDQEKDRNCRWFAAFYFLCRIWILLMALYLPLGPLKRSILEASCIVILGTCLYLQPYNTSYKWLNTLDAVLLANLCLITVFSSALTSDADTSTIHGLKIFINILAYVPLVYLVGLAVYYGHKYVKESQARNKHIRLTDETSTTDDDPRSNTAGETEIAIMTSTMANRQNWHKKSREAWTNWKPPHLSDFAVTPAFAYNIARFYPSSRRTQDKDLCVKLMQNLGLSSDPVAWYSTNRTGRKHKKTTLPRPPSAPPRLRAMESFSQNPDEFYMTSHKKEYDGLRGTPAENARPQSAKLFPNRVNDEDTTYHKEFCEKKSKKVEEIRTGTASGARRNNPHPSEAFMIWKFPGRNLPALDPAEYSTENMEEITYDQLKSTYQNDYTGIPQGVQIQTVFDGDLREHLPKPPYTLDSTSRYSYQKPDVYNELQCNLSRYGCNKNKYKATMGAG
ncbi:hypothetical protein QZH41_018895 [Actinostola sp. cb2023]|nr:hypothetical protein QZH41_018895 [Actinostola sp. cb2023]